MSFTVKVNGNAHSVDVDGDTPLLWVLRDLLGMTGTKFGCGMALCGACTVHIDGAPTRSCITPVDTVGGSAVTTVEAIGATPVGKVGTRRITTIEGLSAGGDHPAQRAWAQIDVPQCGYCQAGQIMAASALLATNPKPDDAAIDEAMSDNLCRCATYTRIRSAVHKAAELAAAGSSAGATQSTSGSGRGAE